MGSEVLPENGKGMELRSRAGIFCFSDRGAAQAEKISAVLAADYEVSCFRPKGNLKELAAALFREAEVLVFVGSCGVAVRAIAPCVVSKTSDPAVIVCDDCGKHVISLLSGHIGGANALTVKIADAVGAEPVITTATDVNGRFSVDAWAKSQGLVIGSMTAAKHFSAEILKRDLPFYSGIPISGNVPAGIYYKPVDLFSPAAGDACAAEKMSEASAGQSPAAGWKSAAAAGESGRSCGAAVTWKRIQPFSETLLLIPKIVRIGIGCRRGTPLEQVERAVLKLLEENEILPESVAGYASIDVKKDEAGLLAFSEKSCRPIDFFTADELNAVPGTFSGSEFVKKTVGTDNVCERAAIAAAGSGARLIARKMSLDGVTCACAVSPAVLEFLSER